MSDPCKQEGNIGCLKATVESIQKTLDRLGVVLEKIAAQGERISSLEDGQDTLFQRVRDVELKAEADRVKIGSIAALISTVIAAVVAAVVKHFS